MKYTRQQFDTALHLLLLFRFKTEDAIDLIQKANEFEATLDSVNAQHPKSIDVAGVAIPAVDGVEIVE